MTISFCEFATLRIRGQQRAFMGKFKYSGKLMNLTKPGVLKFIVSHRSCHSARRTFSSGVAESITGSAIDSEATFHLELNDN